MRLVSHEGSAECLLRCAHVTLRDTRVRHLSWTFLDQGVVSAGAFIVQVTLARRLLAVDYGVFALVFGGLLTLQLCNATLLFHPMSVRVPEPAGAQRPRCWAPASYW